MSISAILLFILILLVLVIVHEFGHFIVAKLVGMRVDEFAFGFPPRLFSKKVGETTYAVNALPLGGYVSILGENGGEGEKKVDDPRAFGNRPAWAQLLVLIAGVTMNMLLAVIIFIGISFNGVRLSVDDPEYGTRVKNAQLIVTEVSEESPAYKAGIVPGSALVSVVSGNKKADLSSATSAVTFIGVHQNTPFTITHVTPDGQEKTTTVAAVYGIVKDKKALGIALDNIGTVDVNFFESIALGVERTYMITVMTVEGLTSVLSSAIKGESVIDSLSGPVGIAKVVGETSDYGYTAILTLIAVLSINLAIFNILPLPALDGGRIVVVVIESVIRRKVPFKYYSWVNIIGFFLLIFLLIIVTINDIKG